MEEGCTGLLKGMNYIPSSFSLTFILFILS